MKLFPNKIFKVELSSDYAVSMQNLKSNTDITELLALKPTNNAFRGKVNENGFKIISSEIGRGAVCVLSGKFKGKTGEIEIRIHNVFKVLFSILMVLPVIAFGITLFTNGIEKSSGIILPMIMAIVFLRFVFIELSFRFISNKGIKKLTDILMIRELNKY